MTRGRLPIVFAVLLALSLPPRSQCQPPEAYVVAPGDTMFAIAERFLGDGARYAEIVELTNARHRADPSYALIAAPELIEVGWKLAIAENSFRSATRVVSNQLPPGASPKGNLREIAVVDRYTVRMSFYEPPRSLLAQLASPALAIHSPTSMQRWGREYLYHPTGSGPYLLRKWVLGSELVLEPNPYYWATPTPQGESIQRVIYRVIPESPARLEQLQSGGVDVVYALDAGDLAVASGDADLRVVDVPAMNVGYLGINADWGDTRGNRPLKDVRVRQAIAHAINKEVLVSQLFTQAGSIAASFVAPFVWGNVPPVPDYNYSPQRARELLDEAGYPHGLATTLWVMPVGRSYMPDPGRVALAVQADLHAVGIEASLVTADDWSEYLAQVDAGAHGLCLLGWTPDALDPVACLYPLFGSATKQWADGGWPDARLPGLLDAACATSDETTRAQSLYEAAAVVHGVVPGVPLVHVGTQLATRSALILTPSPAGERWEAAHYITDTLVIALDHDPPGLDIADETDAIALRVGGLICDSLVATDPISGQIIPSLAERWEASPDGRVWTFSLRKGVRFHDGTPVDADAVLFNLERLWDKEHPYRAGRTRSFTHFADYLGGFRGEPRG